MKRALVTLFLIAGVVGILGSAAEALAVTTLKQVQVSGGSEVDLLFDAKVGKSQVKTEFFNDIIQVSLTDVAVYPAKISSVHGGALTKIFAYQYAPKLVRCRFSVRGKAEDYKDRVKVSANGKILTVRIDDGKTERADNISLQAAAPARGQPANSGERPPITVAVAKTSEQEGKQDRKEKPVEVRDAEERALLDRVLAAPPQRVAGPLKMAEKSGKMLTSAKPLPNFFGVFIKLAVVLSLFVGVALLFKRFLGNKGEREAAGVVGAISRYARNGLGKLAAKDKMIEVLSTHYLGPKKSIVVARVCGRVLVLGVSNDSINLITQLSADGELDLDELINEPGVRLNAGAGAMAAGPAIFADLLNSEKSRPAMGQTLASSKPISPSVAAAAQDAAARQYAATQAPGQVPVQPSLQRQQPGVRAQIRSRLEGLKPL